jgi:hypothetical protein
MSQRLKRVLGCRFSCHPYKNCIAAYVSGINQIGVMAKLAVFIHFIKYPIQDQYVAPSSNTSP